MLTSGVKKSNRSRDPGWNHGVIVPSGSKQVWVQCNYCKNVVSKAGINRLKKHLAGGFVEVVQCTDSRVTSEIRQEMKTSLEENSRNKKSRNDAVITDQAVGEEQDDVGQPQGPVPEDDQSKGKEKGAHEGTNKEDENDDDDADNDDQHQVPVPDVITIVDDDGEEEEEEEGGGEDEESDERTAEPEGRQTNGEDGEGTNNEEETGRQSKIPLAIVEKLIETQVTLANAIQEQTSAIQLQTRAIEEQNKMMKMKMHMKMQATKSVSDTYMSMMERMD